MGARRNHYYYIDRYPLGLDATVFKSGSSTQTMEFTNDTRYPVLIRAYKIRNGSAGYVKFALYSVPTGRKVSFSRPIVKNFRPASDTIQYTSSLPKGASERVEYPVDGKQVWVTRTVRKERQGHPQGDLLLELRADHRDHAGRSLGRSGPQASASGSFM